MGVRSFLKHTLVTAVVATLLTASCGSGGEVSDVSSSAESSAGEVVEGGGEVSENPASEPNDGERTIVMTMDNGDVWDFTGECILEEVNNFGIENTFTVDGSHPDGHELVLVRGGANSDVPFESGSIGFQTEALGGFFTDVDDTLDASVDGDALQVSVDFYNPRGTPGDGYGESFSATITC